MPDTDARPWGVRGLAVSYGHRSALSNVSVDVIPGEVAAVVGGDGAGKTALLRTIAGAVRPAAGEVRAPGVHRLGFMPTTAGVWLDLTVDQNIEFVGAAHGVTGEALAARSEVLLDAAGLAGARSRLGRHLSGGMRQKLAFSLAMIHEPELLILDEPSTGVDPVSRVELWRMIARAAASGAAIIMATTYLDEAERASHVTVLDAGNVLLQGTPEQVLRAMPGHVRHTAAPEHRDRAWRRGCEYREWTPEAPPAGVRNVADLEDAVVGAALAREASHD
jgi:ABC-2 type transport system ATP-binding protein